MVIPIVANKHSHSFIQGFAGLLSRILSVFENGNNEEEREVPQAESHWIAESGVIDLFIVLGPTPKDVFHQYAVLTGIPIYLSSHFISHLLGMPELPPLFALAYHQCRWNYNDENDVATVQAKLDEADIPFDVIWLDIEHTDGKRCVSRLICKRFKRNMFIAATLPGTTASSPRRRTCSPISPRTVARWSPSLIHTSSALADITFTKRPPRMACTSTTRTATSTMAGAGQVGFKNAIASHEYHCGPSIGSSSWLDFMNPAIQSWWSDQLALDKYQGSAMNLYVWNDMNEPSVFNGPEITMHKDAKHFQGPLIFHQEIQFCIISICRLGASRCAQHLRHVAASGDCRGHPSSQWRR